MEKLIIFILLLTLTSCVPNQIKQEVDLTKEISNQVVLEKENDSIDFTRIIDKIPYIPPQRSLIETPEIVFVEDETGKNISNYLTLVYKDLPKNYYINSTFASLSEINDDFTIWVSCNNTTPVSWSKDFNDSKNYYPTLAKLESLSGDGSGKLKSHVAKTAVFFWGPDMVLNHKDIADIIEYKNDLYYITNAYGIISYSQPIILDCKELNDNFFRVDVVFVDAGPIENIEGIDYGYINENQDYISLDNLIEYVENQPIYIMEFKEIEDGSLIWLSNNKK